MTWKILLVMLSAAIAGCGMFRSVGRKVDREPPQPGRAHAVFQPAQLGEIPPERFCRVNGSLPDTFYEGTVVSATPTEITLCEAIAVGPRKMGLLGNLHLDRSSRPSHGTDVDFPDRVTLPREAISVVEVYDAEETARLQVPFAKWRAHRKRVLEQLLTSQDFPSSG